MSSTRVALAEHRVGGDPRHGRGDHEAVAAEPARDEEPVCDRAEDRLVIGRHVVDAGDELRERDVLEARQ